MAFLFDSKSPVKSGQFPGECGGETGIRTLGTQSAQRFSKPPRSTTPAPLLNNI